MNRRGFFAGLAALGSAGLFARFAPVKLTPLPTSTHYSASTFAGCFIISEAALADTKYARITDAMAALGDECGTIVLMPGHYEHI